MKTSGRGKTILQRGYRFEREIGEGVRDGVKVLANTVSANAVTRGQRLVDQRTGAEGKCDSRNACGRYGSCRVEEKDDNRIGPWPGKKI